MRNLVYPIQILIFDEYRELVSEDWLRQITNLTLMLEELPDSSDISIVISDDHTVRQLNKEYRDLDETTDVLAFPLDQSASSLLESEQELVNDATDGFVLPPDGHAGLGDVVISYPRVITQAEDAGHSTKWELSFLLTHGILHLLGYDHLTPDEDTLMRAKQDAILAQVLNYD